jgi:hypothetical protein
MPAYKDPIQRIKDQIIPNINGCHIWQGCVFKNSGYPKISIRNKVYLAHRIVYQHYNGDLIDNLQICHSCMNKLCLNPSHLRQDTISSNKIDNIFSSKHAKQILSVEQVQEIKQKLIFWKAGDNSKLAKEYGVHNSTISDIKRGKSFKCLNK